MKKDLHEIAMAVGADVPFFLVGGRAKGEGHGEKLTPLPDELKRWLVLAQPEVTCLTAEMYQHLDSLDPFDFAEFPKELKVDGIAYNDFQRVAPRPCLDLMTQMSALESDQFGMTGSGSAVFGYFASKERAEAAKRTLTHAGLPWVALVQSLAREV